MLLQIPELENFIIYLNNLSKVYVFSVVISLIAVVTTIYFVKSFQFANTRKKEIIIEKNKEGKDSEMRDNNDTDEDDGESLDQLGDGGLVSKLKAARLRAYEELLTEDQKQAEREIEKAQLAAIYDLLKNQEKDFSLGNSMGEDDLKEQLNLYR